MPKKLIEVSLPLEAINAESAREKSIRHGHPSTLHLWWARRPLATARAVIWASLVDDPSAHPELFQTEEAQRKERDRLFGILTRLVKWENSNNEEVLNEAKAEILKSTGGNPPELLDPFAGGGAIPLEAQRLSLKAHAHDLNPVAVTINRAMIEIPPHFAGMPPVNPEISANILEKDSWPKAAGLAEDVRYYGEKLKEVAWQEIGHLYPKVKVPAEMGGGEATVIAWIWARTVKCPNPACGCEIPLMTSFELSKKAGNRAWLKPKVHADKSISYDVVYREDGNPPTSPKMSQGAKFRCIACDAVTDPEYVKNEALHGRMRSRLVAVVAEGLKGRIYVSPDAEQFKATNVAKPDECPEGLLSADKRAISCPAYGMTEFSDLFTNRQLVMLTRLCNCVNDLKAQIENDAMIAGYSDDKVPIANNGNGAKAYSEAVCIYLSFLLSKLTNYHSNLASWHRSGEKMQCVFGRQAIPMVWDFAEANPFCSSSGSIDNMLGWIVESIQNMPCGPIGSAEQKNATLPPEIHNVMVSTDPPYYDNIGYSDLSDFFYVWLRKTIRTIYPDLYSTMLTPKIDELVAVTYRFDGDVTKARNYFETGMYKTFCNVAHYVCKEIPLTIYYAFKQGETNDSSGEIHTASVGWETMLSAIINAGFSITGTWPMRTEMAGRTRGRGSNALASSIVLVCRLRPADAPVCTKREFVTRLKKELKTALTELKSANIAPVDLAQSAIGPGIGVFSHYSKVLESDGSPMTVRSALYIINDEIDAYFNEQDTGLDRESRFCVDLYTQSAFNEILFGDADILARAKNTSVANMVQDRILKAEKGHVRLLTREEIQDYNGQTQPRWLSAQQLTRAMTAGGVEAAAKIICGMIGSEAEDAKDLAYRLFTIADKKNRTQEAYEYNNLVVAWQDVVSKAAELKKTTAVEQLKLN